MKLSLELSAMWAKWVKDFGTRWTEDCVVFSASLHSSLHVSSKTAKWLLILVHVNRQPQKRVLGLETCFCLKEMALNVWFEGFVELM